MAQATLKYVLAALALIGAAYYVNHLHSVIDVQRTDLAQARGENERLSASVQQLSMERAELDERFRKAQEARADIQRDLDATLRKLRNQKPPVDCNAAVQWAVERKGDLEW